MWEILHFYVIFPLFCAFRWTIAVIHPLCNPFAMESIHSAIPSPLRGPLPFNKGRIGIPAFGSVSPITKSFSYPLNTAGTVKTIFTVPVLLFLNHIKYFQCPVHHNKGFRSCYIFVWIEASVIITFYNAGFYKACYIRSSPCNILCVFKL